MVVIIYIHISSVALNCLQFLFGFRREAVEHFPVFIHSSYVELTEISL